MRRIARLAALTVALVLCLASSAWATDRYASPSGSGTTCSSATPCTLAQAVSSSAASGDRVLLKSGNFGTFFGGSKTSLTITKDTGATPTLDFDFDGSDTGFIFDNISIAGGVLFCSSCTTPQLTFQNDTFTSTVVLNSNTGMTNASDHDAILFDNNTFDFNASCASGANSKIHLSYSATAHSGVTISNNTFKNGSCDGVHSGTGVDILNNEFANLCDVGGNHTDNIQFEGATGGRVAGNWIHESSGCTTQGITSYDSGTHNVLIENNVVDIRRQWGIEWYDDDGSTIRHNTVVYHGGSCYGSNPCGEISIDTKGSCPGTTAVNDNIATAVGGACPFTHTKNMVPSGATGSDFNGTPTFVGGSAPTTFAGFALTCASSGHNAASDGTNVGAITGGEPACSSGVFVDDTFSPPPPPSGFVVDSFS